MDYFADFDLLCTVCNVSFSENYDQRWPEVYSIQYLVKGSMLFGRDSKGLKTLHAPAVYWIHPNHTYQLRNANGLDLRHFLLCRGSRAQRLWAHGFGQINDLGYLPLRRPAMIEDIFSRLAAIGSPSSPVMHARAAVLLDEMLLCLQDQPARTGYDRPSSRAIEDLARQIGVAPHRKWEPEEMAAGLGMSYSHFRRSFRKSIGHSPFDYVVRCRMGAAGKALAEPSRQIKEVAFSVGYEDPCVFAKAFKRFWGISPGRFRVMRSHERNP